MKTCPKCNTNYFDEMLEFCLEDGQRLLQLSGSVDENETVASLKTINQEAEAKTVAFENELNRSAIFETEKDSNLQEKLTEKSDKIKKTVTNHWLNFLEVFPIVLAIFHNYWQWLYLENLSKTELTDFLTSNIFLLWLFLLILGITFGIISLKFSKSKGFAIVSLIILAINLLLSVVPR